MQFSRCLWCVLAELVERYLIVQQHLIIKSLLLALVTYLYCLIRSTIGCGGSGLAHHVPHLSPRSRSRAIWRDLARSGRDLAETRAAGPSVQLYARVLAWWGRKTCRRLQYQPFFCPKKGVFGDVFLFSHKGGGPPGAAPPVLIPVPFSPFIQFPPSYIRLLIVAHDLS